MFPIEHYGVRITALATLKTRHRSLSDDSREFLRELLDANSAVADHTLIDQAVRALEYAITLRAITERLYNEHSSPRGGESISSATSGCILTC